MPSEKTLAIVLRVTDFSETSCVVTLFTRDFGKIGALAKGARRAKSPFESALDVLSVCRIVFIHKSSDSLHLLTEAKLDRRFRSASRNLSRLYAGYYVAELLNELTDVGDPHPDLFVIADQTMQAIDGQGNLAREVLRFELTALRILGHAPSLVECVGCGQVVEHADRIGFGQLAGGVLCATCRVGRRKVVSVSGPVIDTLKVFAEPDEDRWRNDDVDQRVLGELRGVMNHYFNNLLGHRLRTQALLGTLA